MARLKILGGHTWQEVWQLIKGAGVAWIDDYAPSMGAALSYYTVFSLAPLLLIVISIAGLVFGEDAARGELFAQLNGFMGADGANAVQELLKSLNKPAQGITGAVIGVGVLLIGATTVFGELQDSLDRIWRAPARDKAGGLWGLLRARILSFGMILGIAFLLMVSLVLGAVIAALGRWWGDVFGGWELLAQVVNLLIGFLLTTAVFAMIYKLMPRVNVRWRDVALGSLVTATMFTVGKFLIGLYIGKSGVASGFGAAGSLIVVFVWVYYSAQIFLMGAEFTWIYARMFGSLRGTPYAIGGDAAPAAIPSRSGDAAAAVLPAAQPTLLPRPATAMSMSAAAPATSAAAIGSPDAGAPVGPKRALKDLGTGLAVALVLKYVLPRLLRRL